MKHEKGFTLIEVITSTVLAAIVLTAVIGFLSPSFSHWERVRKEVALYQSINKTLEILTQDIKRIPAPFYPSRIKSSLFPIEVKKDKKIEPINYLFLSNSITSGDTYHFYFTFRINYLDKEENKFKKALVRYHYMYEPSKGGILSRGFANLPENPSTKNSLSDYDPSPHSGAGRWSTPKVILTNIEEFKVWFLDENNNQFEEWNFYDSYRLPVAIRIKIRAGSPSYFPGKEEKCTFITSISIPVWDYE
jgi:prepilin-type N-terminal cleavage/methylation domain-containing protein